MVVGSKIKDLTNQKFTRLAVIELHSIDNRSQAVWECLCDCGNTVTVSSRHLVSGATQSCGCYMIERTAEGRSKKLLPGDDTSKNAYSSRRASAKSRKLIFDLTYDQFMSIVQRECYYCGSLGTNRMKGRHFNLDFIFNGIDRVDSNKGYILDNCVTCCKICNYAKHTMTVEEFDVWLKRIVNHRFGIII